MAEEYSNQNAKKVLVADSDPAVLQAMKDQLQARLSRHRRRY